MRREEVLRWPGAVHINGSEIDVRTLVLALLDRAEASEWALAACEAHVREWQRALHAVLPEPHHDANPPYSLRPKDVAACFCEVRARALEQGARHVEFFESGTGASFAAELRRLGATAIAEVTT